MLRILYKDNVTSREVCTKIQQAIGPHEDLLTLVKRRKLQGQNHLARHSERGKKTRQTEEEVERQHQGTVRPGVWQVPEDHGEQGKWRQWVAKSSVVPQQPLSLIHI